MSDGRHASRKSPSATSGADRKIDMMGTALRGVEAGLAIVVTCVPTIENQLIRVEIGQATENIRLLATSLREKFEASAAAGSIADIAVAFVRALKSLLADVRGITERVDAAEELAGGICGGLLSDSLVEIRQGTEAFWHLLVLLLRQWVAAGLIDLKFEDCSSALFRMNSPNGPTS